mmetsp:Transcript_132969/g.244496  ORF Transcript_132969/g.244496 Transcript_132969/m.244496 type:complete len:81 (-) Transcript_132969:410-652(-)
MRKQWLHQRKKIDFLLAVHPAHVSTSMPVLPSAFGVKQKVSTLSISHPSKKPASFTPACGFGMLPNRITASEEKNRHPSL